MTVHSCFISCKYVYMSIQFYFLFFLIILSILYCLFYIVYFVIALVLVISRDCSEFPRLWDIKGFLILILIHKFNPEYTLPSRRPSQTVEGK